MGGNPFEDPVLDTLVGKTIDGEGELAGQTFLLRMWTIIDSEE
jgi:hypothetical protein